MRTRRRLSGADGPALRLPDAHPRCTRCAPDTQVPGRDFAGVVLEADPGSAFPPGARVFGFVAYPSPGRNRLLRLPRGGAFAERVCVPEAHLAAVPRGLGFEAAAGLPLAATTAWQVLPLGRGASAGPLQLAPRSWAARLSRAASAGGLGPPTASSSPSPRQALEALRLQPGQHVLIHAGAGGVGSVAVQLAKARWGLRITTTCSTRNLAFVKVVGEGGAPSRSTSDRPSRLQIGGSAQPLLHVPAWIQGSVWPTPTRACQHPLRAGAGGRRGGRLHGAAV